MQSMNSAITYLEVGGEAVMCMAKLKFNLRSIL